MNRFSWIREGKLAGMAFPLDETACHDLQHSRLGVQAVLSLTEDKVESLCNGMPFYKHYPLEDFGAPTVQDLRTCVDWIRDHLDQQRPVAVHCMGGKGRTGTILAACLVATEGVSAEDAIREVRRLRPHSVETQGQEMSVALFAEHHLRQQVS